MSRGPVYLSRHEYKKVQPEDKAKESMHHDGSMAKYMEHKNRKLGEQFAQQAADAAALGPSLQGQEAKLFAGISIHVNGFTTPSHQELKQLMAIHGGNFENYYSRSRVTHIVCSNLPDAKVKQYDRERNPTPVVRPEWVVDSLKAGAVLPIHDYVLWQLREAPGQRSIKAFAEPSPHKSAPSLTASAPAPLEPPPSGPQVPYPGHLTTAQHMSDGAAQLPKGAAAAHAMTSAAAGPLAAPLEARRRLEACEYLASEPPPSVAAELRQLQQQVAASRAAQAAQAQHQAQNKVPVLHQAQDEALGRDAQRAQHQVQDQAPVQVELHARHQPQAAQAQARLEANVPEAHAAAQAASSLPAPGQHPEHPAHAHVAADAVDPAQLQALSRESTPSNALSDSDADELQAADEARVWDADGEWEASDYRPRASDQLNLAKATGSAAEPIAARHDPDARPLTSHAASASDREAQRIAAAARAACDVLKGAPRSSADDPNFMETFFKSSRLHFIGTWKARIEALHATMAVSAPVPQQAMPSVHAESGQRSLFMGSTASRAAERSIIHLDMDCFFASVAALGNPAFEGKPLAVCHSSSAQGTGEVSSANYEARKYGLKAGMFIAEAKRRCPALIVMPYEFDKYEAVSEAVYKILLKYTACVQPISCDEAFLDVTGLGDPEQVAASMRADIQASTGCTASAGIGPNMLVARMATKRGKPNGQFRIPSSAAGDYLNDMEVSDLPGVGWSMARKLESIGIAHVRDVKQRSKAVLQRELGTKSGSMLWNFAHGRDDRPVDPPKARKSVGAEVNWGIRFGSDADSDKFLDELAGEVAARMAAAGVRGRSITLKLKRRKAGAPEPIKFMGHGVCDNLSRSVTLSRFTSAAADLAAEGKAMLRALRVPAQQIRGVGLAVTKLDTDAASLSAKPAGPVPKAAPPPSAYTPADDRGWQEFVTAASPLGKTTGTLHQPSNGSPAAGVGQRGPDRSGTTPSKQRVLVQQLFGRHSPKGAAASNTNAASAATAQSPPQAEPVAAHPAALPDVHRIGSLQDAGQPLLPSDTCTTNARAGRSSFQEEPVGGSGMQRTAADPGWPGSPVGSDDEAPSLHLDLRIDSDAAGEDDDDGWMHADLTDGWHRQAGDDLGDQDSDQAGDAVDKASEESSQPPVLDPEEQARLAALKGKQPMLEDASDPAAQPPPQAQPLTSVRSMPSIPLHHPSAAGPSSSAMVPAGAYAGSAADATGWREQEAVTLDTMDAATFAELPQHLQQELLESLPQRLNPRERPAVRQTHGTSGPAVEHRGHQPPLRQQPAPGVDSPPAASAARPGSAGPAAAAQPAAGTSGAAGSHLMPPPPRRTTPQRGLAAGKPLEAPDAARRAQMRRPAAEDHNLAQQGQQPQQGQQFWAQQPRPAFQPQVPQHTTHSGQQEQQQQQHGAIQALPPASQVDASVLDALPLAMKRELERAYGVQDLHSPPAKRKRGGGRGTLSRPHKQTTLSSRTTSAAPQQLPAVPALQQPRMHARVAVGGLTMTQIDPEVLAELPPEVQQELRALLPISHDGFSKRGNLRVEAPPASEEPDQAPGQHHSSIAAAIAVHNSGHGGWNALAGAGVHTSMRQPQLGVSPGRQGGQRSTGRQGTLSQPPAEEPREVWASFYRALQQIEQEAAERAGHAEHAGPAVHADERLQTLADVAVQYGTSLVGNNLEGVQFWLRRVQQAGASRPVFAPYAEQIIAAVQAEVQQQCNGPVHFGTLFDRQQVPAV